MTKLPSPQPTHTEVAAMQYCYDHIEAKDPHILSAIERDLKNGLRPEQIASIWLRKTGQDQMAKMVGLAARFIAEGQ